MKNKNKNMDNLFKENWFVFDGTEGADEKQKDYGSAPEAPAPTAEDLAAKKKEGEEVVTATTGTQIEQEKVKLETKVGLEKLKESLKKPGLEKINEIINKLSVLEQLNKSNYTNLVALQMLLQNNLKDQITDDDVSSIETLLDTGGKDSKQFFAGMVAFAFAADIVSKFSSNNYKYLKDLPDFAANKIKLSLTIDSGEITIPKPEDIPGYTEHAEAEKKKAEEEDKTADAAKTEEEKQAEQEKAKLSMEDEIKNHPLGEYLVGFLSISEDGKPSTLDQLSAGGAPVWRFILGLLGVGGFVKGYEKVKGMAAKSPQAKAFLDSLEKKVKTWVPDEAAKKEEGADSTETAENYKPANNETFKNFIKDGDNFPSEGVKLSEGFKIEEGKALEIVGGEVILAKNGDSVNYQKDGVIDTKIANDQSKSLKKPKIVLLKSLPKDLVIKADSIKRVTV